MTKKSHFLSADVSGVSLTKSSFFQSFKIMHYFLILDGLYQICPLYNLLAFYKTPKTVFPTFPRVLYARNQIQARPETTARSFSSQLSKTLDNPPDLHIMTLYRYINIICRVKPQFQLDVRALLQNSDPIFFSKISWNGPWVSRNIMRRALM